MKVLVIGFTPFGGETVNPSYEAVKLLPDRVEGMEIIKALLTTEFDTCVEELGKLIDSVAPDAVLCVGQAGGRAGITVEKVAVNYAVAPDDKRGAIQGNTINTAGSAAYFSTLPAEKLVEAVNAAGIPCSLSMTAGTYVCNYVFYSLLEMTRSTGVLGGFVHIPYSPGQGAGKSPVPPTMDIGISAKALVDIIKNIW